MFEGAAFAAPFVGQLWGDGGSSLRLLDKPKKQKAKHFVFELFCLFHLT